MPATIAIHQPEYFPWPGFLEKARRADLLVLLDHVQFDRASLQHRAKLAPVGGGPLVWLTIPFVHKFPQRIDELEFADARWATKHAKTLSACYGRAPAYRAVAPALEAFFAGAYPRVVDATAASVRVLLDAFAITTPVVRSSTLPVAGDKGELVLALCRHLGATRYLSGRTGAAYLDGAAFAAAGVGIEVVTYTPPPVPRRVPYPPDARGVSALDAWLHLGADAGAWLRGA